jgi:hypothetical protein
MFLKSGEPSCHSAQSALRDVRIDHSDEIAWDVPSLKARLPKMGPLVCDTVFQASNDNI